MTQQSMDTFLKTLSSSAPVPGGGGASAYVAAVGMSLGSMVANLTTGKKKYAEYQEEIEQIIEKAGKLTDELADYMQKDAVAFEPLSKAYVRIVTRMPLRDATAGFVCYSRRALETIDLDAVRMKGYGFQIEMKYSAWRLGMRLKEVSIIFVERREGTSKMSGGIFGEAFFGVLKLPFRRIRKRK